MVSVWGMTDKGIVRRENQDSCAYDIIEEGKLAWGVVCDGMGGAKAGDVASKMAVEAFCTQMDQLGDLEGPPPAEALLRTATEDANRVVYLKAQTDADCIGMGTTLVLAVVVKLILDLYFRTKSGLLLRATGDNGTLVTTLAQNKGNMKILGVVISNALVALCGAVVCQEQRSYSAVMGIGQVVFGLATVIIGISLIRFFTRSKAAQGLRKVPVLRVLASPKGTMAVLLGSVIYKFCVQIAISAGLPANMLKFITAALFLVVLVIAGRKGEEIIHA